MDPQRRSKFNADFRFSETPIFLTDTFTEEVTEAVAAIVDRVRTLGVCPSCVEAIPAGLAVPNETAHPTFSSSISEFAT